jgi:hypothetical protein
MGFAAVRAEGLTVQIWFSHIIGRGVVRTPDGALLYPYQFDSATAFVAALGNSADGARALNETEVELYAQIGNDMTTTRASVDGMELNIASEPTSWSDTRRVVIAVGNTENWRRS